VKLTTGFLEKYKDVPPKWGYDALGWVIYQRTYSRPLPEGGNEVWWQTVQRVVEGVYDIQQKHSEQNGLPWNAIKAQLSAQKMYDLIFNFKFLPPGRGLWAMGTEHVKKRGSAALNNCAFISTSNIREDFAHPFCWLMDMSMLGVGVGSDTAGAGTVTIKEPRVIGTHVVDDSREGWVESVRVLLSAYGHGSSLPATFDYTRIREAGKSINGFGGIAPGHRPLQDLHESLQQLLSAAINTTITSTLIVDIHNLVGRAVVSGGIRRTAEIILGAHNDAEFLSLKDPSKYASELRSHRWASNNSIIAETGIDYTRYVDQILTNGEPGFFWLDNAQHYKRMVDPRGDWDTFICGQNPCGEIGLESGEFCNLVEVYPAHHETQEELLQTMKWAYLYAKSVALMPTHDPYTNAIVGRNRRLGVSVTGITQAVTKFGLRKFMGMLDVGYNYLRYLDTQYSKWLCVPNSIKLTTVKPSGTVSLVAGATPGIHFPHSEYYIRRVRFDPHSALLPVLRDNGYHIEESAYADNTYVVNFPVKEKLFDRGKAQVGMWEQFELAAQMQHWWADNSVSVTVTVDDQDAEHLARALSLYETRLKSVSILPLKEHGYVQAPYETIDATQYADMLRGIKPIEHLSRSAHDVDEVGCTSDSCSII
jgi:adenosylcobalamin-dependent ribonucleoside-triphosphate reductase